MKNTLGSWFESTVWVSVLTIVISFFGWDLAAAQTRVEDATTPKIMIWVYNYARIPKNTMARAEREVQTILGSTTVHFEWVDCPTSAEEVKVNPICQERMSDSQLGLTILSTARGVADAYADRDFGIAQVFNNGQFGHYAYIFLDRVRYGAQLEHISESQLLASVICHEFGHLLLRSSTHSKSGIMRMRWDRDDLRNLTWGRLTFTPEEAEMIHTEALLRLRSSSGLTSVSPKPAPSNGR